MSASLSSSTNSPDDDPLVICVAPNGARRTKADHPALPITPQELAIEAKACQAAGAQVIHLHVRDDEARHVLDPVRYREAIAAIQSEAPGMIIQATSESVGLYDPEQQAEAMIALTPQAASVALRELAPTRREATAADFYATALQRGIAIQHILYSPEEAQRFRLLQREGIIPEAAPNVLFVLGRYTTGQVSTPSDALPFLLDWPDGWPWSLCAFGQSEPRCMALAIALGGHVRVGFENNLLRIDGTLAAGTYDNVENIARIAAATGRRLATADEAALIYRANPVSRAPSVRKGA